MNKVFHPGETLGAHPYAVNNPNLRLTNNLIYVFDALAQVERGIVNQHQAEPIDMIVGDDVSGRVPTLITHRFLRLAQAGGQVDTVPDTRFVTSGLTTKPDTTGSIDEMWRRNLKQYVGQLAGGRAVRRVLIVTESVQTGLSVARIREAFTHHGVEASHQVTGTLYLSGHGSQNSDRPVVGVEKFAPEPTSRRHPDFDGKKTAELRRFLHDYTDALYEWVYGECPETRAPVGTRK